MPKSEGLENKMLNIQGNWGLPRNQKEKPQKRYGKIGENNLLKYLKDHLNINRSSLQNVPLQKDFEVRELREFNKNVTKQIGESVQQNPDIAQAVHLYFSQADLPPPPTQGILESFNQLLPSLFSTKRNTFTFSQCGIHLFTCCLAGLSSGGSDRSSVYSSRMSSARSSLSSVRSSTSVKNSSSSGIKPTAVTIGADFG